MNTWIYSHLLDGKASAYDAGNLGSVPESGRSSGERNVNPLQYSCLENPMDRGAPSYSPLGRKDSDTTEWLLFCHLKKNSLFLDSDTPIQILSCLFLLKVTFFGKKKKSILCAHSSVYFWGSPVGNWVQCDHEQLLWGLQWIFSTLYSFTCGWI